MMATGSSDSKSSNLEKIRLKVFHIWFITLSVAVVVFAEQVSGLFHLRPPFASLFESFQMITGLILPQLSVMLAFYFNLERQTPTLNALSSQQIKILTLLSCFYHIVFISSLVFGVGFNGFDATADGRSLERNTAAVVAIMGVFSLMLAPIAFLFSSPPRTRNTRTRAPVRTTQKDGSGERQDDS